MKKIKLMNKIAKCGTDRFSSYNYEYDENILSPDAVMVRSADMHNYDFGNELKAIARAGAGTNNIPLEECAEKGIVVFNTPGANANAVKELVICGMLLSCRDIIGGINWVHSSCGEADITKLIEKEKSRFAGTELFGKTLGIIGLGAIGGFLANAAVSLGMNVLGFDPYISVDAAWKISGLVKKVDSREEIFKNSDFISLHTPLIADNNPKINTKHMINKNSIAMMKDGAVILNFARDALVNDDDMELALNSGKLRRYVTDFPNIKTADMNGVIAIPHLGASTEESEENCAVMAANELINYLEFGNIKNSVNYPDVEMPRSDGQRLVILHKNIPNMISHISSAFSSRNINIENMLNRSRGNYACTLVDILTDVNDSIISYIKKVDGIIRVLKIR